MKIENISDHVFRVTDNGVVSLTFYLATENCPQNLSNTIKVSVVTSVAMEQEDLCRIRYENGAYQKSDTSRHCHLDKSTNKMKFVFNITSKDMRVKFTLTSASPGSSLTFVDIVGKLSIKIQRNSITLSKCS